MTINIILATDLDLGIGIDNHLPWPTNRKDMEWFRDNTLGHVVVMGRKTWESLGSKPLKKRINVVITSRPLEGPDVVLSGDMGMNLRYLEQQWPGLCIWVVGGADIYSQCIPYTDRVYLTTFNDLYACDTHVSSDVLLEFPVIDHKEDCDSITFQIRSRDT